MAELNDEQYQQYMAALQHKPALVDRALADMRRSLESLKHLGMASDEVAIKLGLRQKRKSPVRKKAEAAAK